MGDQFDYNLLKCNKLQWEAQINFQWLSWLNIGNQDRVEKTLTQQNSPLSQVDEGEYPWLNIVLDRLPKPFFLIDFETRKISFSNASARRVMGMDYAKNPAKTSYPELFQLYDINDNFVEAQNLPSNRVLNGEKISGEEFLLISRSGKHNIKIYSEHIPKTKNTPNLALIVFQEITELKKIENDLRQTQEDLNEAVKIAQVGFWSLDTATSKATLSPQLMEQFGIDPEKYSGYLHDAVAAIHPADRERVTKAINKSITEYAPYHIEYRILLPDNSIRWIEAKSGRHNEGYIDSKRFTGTTLDVTERVNARQIREASENELMRLADSMPQIVWSADANGEIDYFNKVWLNYSGSTFEESKGFGWLQYVHPEDRTQTFEKWKSSISYKKQFENDFRLRNADGDYRWYVGRAVPIFNNEDTVEKWYGTNTDINEQKLLSSKLEEAWSSAERANSAKSQFLANMSHEIRTPLGAIMGFADLIKDSSLEAIDRDKYISVIERNSNQLMRIIDDILDLSKVEAGMMSMEFIEFSLEEVLNDFTSLMGIKAREKGVSFVLKTISKLPSKIVSDPTRLRQILMNVLGNAIKFTETGKVELRVSFLDHTLEFEIEDTGRGISPEHADRLFKPFAQGDSSTTRKYGGTGLGLVLTRSLAEALGGDFVLKNSTLNSGSLFVVRIQALVPEKTSYFSDLNFNNNLQTLLNDQNKLGGAKLLLVEDSPDNQALISIYLGRAGASIDIAYNGEEGIEKAMSKKSYDLVLMDVQMPVLDGISAVKELRRLGYDKPIIALTAHAMKEERDRCLEAGFTDFLSKPVNREDLIKMVQLNTVNKKNLLY